MKFLKKVLFSCLICICLSSLTSCFTLGLVTFSNDPIESSFTGTMDITKGYENIPWYSSKSEITNMDGGYPLEKVPNLYGVYSLSKEYYDSNIGNYRIRDYSHNGVNYTAFTFSGQYYDLIEVKDFLIERNPSMEYLHNRYGDFSEKNVSNDDEYIAYTKVDENDPTKVRLIILIEKKTGETVVTVREPYLADTYNYENMNVESKDYLQPYNQWHCIASVDEDNPDFVHYYFVNKTEQGGNMLLWYKKNIKNPVLSVVRAGINVAGSSSNGQYEIKYNGNIETRRLDAYYFEIEKLYKTYHAACDESSLGRYFYELFLTGDKFSARYGSNTIDNFDTKGFKEILAQRHITTDEIFFAIENEEF